MTRPELPPTSPGEVLLICTCYQDGLPEWGGLRDSGSGRGVRLRQVEDPGWDFLHGGEVPALIPAPAAGGAVPPVAVLVDIPVVFGGDGPLLVDLAVWPGRGVRVAPDRLEEVLAELLDGTLSFDDLVRGMDLYGLYQGDGPWPAFPVPATDTAPRPVVPLPVLPAGSPGGEAALLVRTYFDDEAGWRALLEELGGLGEAGWIGGELDPDALYVDPYPLTALVVDDRAYEGLPPGRVPGLTPLEEDPTLVALADARTFAEPGRPLTVVDLYDIPGRQAVLPCREVGSMSGNLGLANMDFHEFIAEEGVRPWWETA